MEKKDWKEQQGIRREKEETAARNMIKNAEDLRMKATTRTPRGNISRSKANTYYNPGR